MTKQQISDDTTLRYHLALEEGIKSSPGLTEAIVRDALVVNSSSVGIGQEGKRGQAQVRAKMRLLNSRLVKIMRGLYDLESGSEHEKTLNVELDLYQMESF